MVGEVNASDLSDSIILRQVRTSERARHTWKGTMSAGALDIHDLNGGGGSTHIHPQDGAREPPPPLPTPSAIPLPPITTKAGSTTYMRIERLVNEVVHLRIPRGIGCGGGRSADQCRSRGIIG